VRGWERIHPALPDGEVQRLLGITAEQAVFVVTRYTECESGPLEWHSTVVRGDAYSFTTSWSSSESSSEFKSKGEPTRSQ
jgi:DNA-binding GntR family transcriptional regulator